MEITRNNKEYVSFNNLVYLEANPDNMKENDTPLVYDINVKDRKQSA